MSYCKTQIGDLVTLRQGFAINKKTNHHMSEEPTMLHLLRIGDMKDGNFSIFVRDTIPEKFIAKENDIIYTRTGQVGLVFRNQYGVVHNNCFTVTSNDEDVLSQQYLYYALQEESFYEEANSRATGAAQPDLPHGAFNSIEIFLPPVEVQRRITNILDAYNSLIDNNQKQIKLLEEAAQRLYKEWFVDLRFPGYEGTEIVDGVPSGWKKTVLNEVFSFERGKSYASKELSDSEGVVLVNLKNIQAWGGYKREAEKRFIGKYKESQTVEFGDIVMAVTDMTQERRLVGHVALVPDLGEKATYSMDLIKLIPSKGINSFFLYSSLRYSGIAENISKHANGTNVLHLKPDSIMGLEYIIPSAELMDLFGSMVETICKKVEVLQSQMILLSNARDRLLPKLMSGEIEV